MGVITIDDFDRSKFLVIGLSFGVPLLVVFIIWCVLLAKYFEWKPFLVYKYVIANSMKREIQSGLVQAVCALWWLFFLLPFLISLGFGITTAVMLKPVTLGITIAIAPCALMLLLLSFKYYAAQGYRHSVAVKGVMFFSLILLFGLYVVVVFTLAERSWMATGYLLLWPPIIVYAWVIYYTRRKLKTEVLPTIYQTEENKERFITELEQDKFADWFEGSGKLNIWWALLIFCSSVLFNGIYIGVFMGANSDEKLATIGTAGASFLVDFLLIISQYNTIDNSKTLGLLFIGYVIKMAIVTFSAKYWLVGHGFLFLVLGTEYISLFLDWVIVTIVSKTNAAPPDVTTAQFTQDIAESIAKLNPEYVKPKISEIVLTTISLVLMVIAVIFELMFFDDESKLKYNLPFGMQQDDAYIALIVLAVVFGFVLSTFTSVVKSKYKISWPVLAIFVIAAIITALFYALFKGIRAVKELQYLVFLVLFLIFGGILEGLVIIGNDSKLYVKDAPSQMQNVASIFLLIFVVIDAICLIAVPFKFSRIPSLGLIIFFGLATIAFFIVFCISFLQTQHFTCTSSSTLITSVCSLIGLCITVLVVSKQYFIAIIVAVIVIVIGFLAFAIMWTKVNFWRFSLGPMLIISIVSAVLLVIAAAGYFVTDFDSLSLIVGLISSVVLFSSISFYFLQKNQYMLSGTVIICSICLGILIVITVVGLFFELKSFFVSITALFAILFVVSLIVVGGYVAASSNTDVIIFSNFFVPVRRLFNGILTSQGFFLVLTILIFVFPWVWGLIALSLLKWPQMGSLVTGASFVIILFIVFSLVYNFDGKSLNAVEYMEYKPLEFAVNKAIKISGNTIEEDMLPPKDLSTYQGFMTYHKARISLYYDRSTFESALKAQLYITAESSFDLMKQKVEAYCSKKAIMLPFLQQKEFTPLERKLLFMFAATINKSNAAENAKDQEYLDFVNQQEILRNQKIQDNLNQSQNLVAEYSEILSHLSGKYVDKQFHPSMNIVETEKNILANSEWKRAETIFKGTVTGKANPNEICQGSIGDCYLISAMAAISESSKDVEALFTQPAKIVESGSACISFNAMGKKLHVIIDTQLPFSTKSGKAKFVQPRDVESSSWWFTLVEKAYAKLNGSFSAIVGGNSHVALNRLMGGWPESFDLDGLEMKEQINNGVLWKRMLKWHEQKDFICCGSHSGSDTTKNKSNIVQGHAYSVLHVAEIKGFKLLQLRNPWGDSEWNGEWSDSSPLWAKHPDVAKQLGHSTVDDGMFWMTFKDFCANYSQLYVSLRLLKGWKCREIYGKLTPGDHDGAKPVTKGPGADLLTQYLVKFRKATTIKLTLEKTGGDVPIWVYAVYNKGGQVKKLYKGMVYKTEAVAPNAVLQSFEWSIEANQIEFPWTFIVCRNKMAKPNDFMLRIWTNSDIDPIDEIKPGAQPATPPPAAAPAKK